MDPGDQKVPDRGDPDPAYCLGYLRRDKTLICSGGSCPRGRLYGQKKFSDGSPRSTSRRWVCTSMKTLKETICIRTISKRKEVRHVWTKRFAESDKLFILSFVRGWGRLKCSISPRGSAPSNQFPNWIGCTAITRLKHLLSEFACVGFYCEKPAALTRPSPNYKTAGLQAISQ